MLNNIPVIGWILDIFFKASMAVPFWLIWTVAGIGPRYFHFLPSQFHAPGFMATAGIFVCLGILKWFSPFDVSASSSADQK